MSYKFLEGIATADVAVEARGESLGEAFGEAALAMFEVQTDTKKVEPSIEKKVMIKSEDKESLLFDWLSKLLYLRDIERMFFSKFNVRVKKFGKNFELIASAYGERIDASKHEFRTEVKGISYSQMEIQEKYKTAKVVVVLDV